MGAVKGEKSASYVATFYIIFVIATTVLLVVRRHHREIAKVGWWLTTMQAISNLVFVTNILIFQAYLDSYPGFILFWLTSMTILLWILCVIGKTLRLLILYRWNEAKLGISDAAMRRATIEMSKGQGTPFNPPDSKDRADGLARALSAHRAHPEIDLRGSGKGNTGTGPRKRTKKEKEMIPLFKIMGYYYDDPDSELWSNPEGSINRKIARMILFAMGVQFLGCLALQVLVPEPVQIAPVMAKGQMQIKNIFKTHFLSSYIFCALYLVVFSPIFIYLLRDVKDASGIRIDIITTLVAGLPLFVLWFFVIFARSLINNIGMELSGTYIAFLLFLITHITSVVIPVWVSYRIDNILRRKLLEQGAGTACSNETVGTGTTSNGSTAPSWSDTRLIGSSTTGAAGSTTRSKYGWRRHIPEPRKWSDAPPSNQHRRCWTRFLTRLPPWLLLHRIGNVSLLDDADADADIEEGSGGARRPRVDLTTKSFHRLLDDPRLFAAFKRFCARDLCIESAVFHESYVFLRRAYGVLIEAGIVSGQGVHSFFAAGSAKGGAGRGGAVEDMDPSLVDTSTPSGAIAGQCHYIWDTFLRNDSPLEIKGVSPEARERLEEGLRTGYFSPDLFEEVARENMDYMFYTVYPKFVIAYHSKSLPPEDY
ncbi:hypothetical protein HDU96_009220 [Phlyctochytrium bullatum]|nr:hypothetical protein HDU96_009220 [Phlyctochytrium bullatum]